MVPSSFSNLSSNLQIVQYVRAIRNGWLKTDEPKEESQLYNLWGDDSSSTEKASHGLAFIPAPKPKLPGIGADASSVVDFF